MNQTTTTYCAGPRGVAVFGFVLCAVLAVLFWSVTWNSRIARTISVVCGLIALMLVFYKQVSIDTTHGVVTETTLLFGLLRVRRRERRLSKFRAICCYVSNESEGGSQTWAVALDPEAGYPLGTGSEPLIDYHWIFSNPG